MSVKSSVFIALQCFQCSTMQVKRQKKSSNKWVCVVCNQKQSVRKVFSQGYKAKEVRIFVQSFNMSRKSADEEQAMVNTSEINVDGGNGDSSPVNQTKRRADWNEYIDLPNCNERETEQEQGNEGEGSDFKPKIVTEMPEEMFKKPRLSNYASAGRLSATREENKGKEKETRTLERVLPKPALRWDAYMSQEEDVDLHASRGGNLMDDDIEKLSRAVCQTSPVDQRVEDDIHPDFL